MQHLQITVARIGVDLGIFDALNETKEPLSVVTLAEKTGAAPELLGMLKSKPNIPRYSLDHQTEICTRSYSTCPCLLWPDKGDQQGSLYFKFDNRCIGRQGLSGWNPSFVSVLSLLFLRGNQADALQF